MRSRPSARLLIIDPQQRVLLFCFCHNDDALAGQRYWATPGGAVEEDESWEQAAMRELFEETGIVRKVVGHDVGRREFTMQLPSGEHVLAQERYFLVRVERQEISTSGWSDHERQAMTDSRWWSQQELAQSAERYFPENLLCLLADK